MAADQGEARAVEIAEFGPTHREEVASWFVAALEGLRAEVPALSAAFTDLSRVLERLRHVRGVAALQDGRLVGYLAGWWPIERFRGAERTGAYVPEWGHGAVGENRPAVYRALYRAAARSWFADGVGIHAITLLANDALATESWFWNGFGMGTVDAVRPSTPLGVPVPDGYLVRAAVEGDIATLVTLDAEHTRHYGGPPVFMAPPTTLDGSAWRAYLAAPGNGVWLAEDATGPIGFVRFTDAFGGADVVEDLDGAFIDGAYVRPAHRGKGVAAAVLDGALRDLVRRARTSCAVDFEAFNPEAAALWMRHFTPVCRSLLRIPEVSP